MCIRDSLVVLLVALVAHVVALVTQHVALAALLVALVAELVAREVWSARGPCISARPGNSVGGSRRFACGPRGS
eukprot:8690611-Pyramimonas_sp.AAC.1